MNWDDGLAILIKILEYTAGIAIVLRVILWLGPLSDKKVLDLLSKYEWDDVGNCIECGNNNTNPNGHLKSCKLKRIIRGLAYARMIYAVYTAVLFVITILIAIITILKFRFAGEI